MTTSEQTTEPTSTDTEPTPPKSKRQPAWHIVLLSVFTLSLYEIVWFYKTVRDLKQHALDSDKPAEPEANPAKSSKKSATAAATKLAADPALAKYKKANPFWITVALLTPTALGPLVFLLPLESGRAIAPLVPLVTLGFFGYVYCDIARVGREGSLLRNNPSFPAFCLVVAMAMLWALYKLPNVFYLCFTLVSIPTAIAQHWLNDYWERVEPADAHMRRSFSLGEIITLLVGSLPLTAIMLAPRL